MPTENSKPLSKDEFRKKLEAELQRRFLVGADDVCDSDQQFANMQPDETPESIAKELGNHYDLTDFTECDPWLRP